MDETPMNMTAEDNPASSAMRARFEQHALPHLDMVYRMARTLTGDEVEAEDLSQETFARAYSGFDRFELREYGARPWLLRILYNAFYSQRMKHRREPTLLDDVDFDHFADELDGGEWDADTADSINWDNIDEELKRAVANLQPAHRNVILLWSVEGLSYKEIAHVCDCALGTVMSRLYRARQLLKRELLGYARDRRISTERLDR